jgi:GT2 family glycosyltransferase
LEQSNRARGDHLDYSIIVSLYNRLDLTLAFLETLESTLQGISYEAILIDDGSTDGTRDYLQQLRSPYRILLNERRRNYSANNNLGARGAQADVLVLLNNDLLLTPGWLHPMVQLLNSSPDVGAVGNIQINPRTRLVDHAGVAFHRDGSPFHSWKNRRFPPKGDFREMKAASAACLLIKRQRFLDVGGFDECFVNGSEDIDLCIRLRRQGYRILIANRSIIYHHVSSSPGRLEYVKKNEEILQSKWSEILRAWGRGEWAEEYLHRYARHVWRMRPTLALWALASVAKKRLWR